ncbi:MAG TPA: gluconate 2-dehydrogenase subunit 3 family protein [Vicinamibacteria bacterium]|nr:gluconate 2-dehydrogenase subunit 3 family protein [Vicinamibacteria bacterium]
MSAIHRRSALRLIGGAPAAVAFALSPREAAAAAETATRAVAAAARGKAYAPKFFNPQEWKMVRVLVDMIIPADERSGSATDAGVPEFMDHLMNDPTDSDSLREWRQTAMRGGLAWINSLCARRFGKDFVEGSEAQRIEVLDEVAYVRDEDTEVNEMEESATFEATDRRVRIEHGPAFFNSFRDLTASGFWSSKMGIEDLQYMGNKFLAEWKGPPPEVLAKLGLPTD